MEFFLAESDVILSIRADGIVGVCEWFDVVGSLHESLQVMKGCDIIRAEGDPGRMIRITCI